MRIVSVLILASSSLLAQSGYQQLVREYASSPADADDFVARFQKGAEQNAGTEAAVPFLLWIFENGGPHRAATQEALDVLMEEHLESPAMTAVADRLPYLYPILGEEEVRNNLDRLVEVTDPGVRARARYSRASLFLTRWGDRAEGFQKREAEADLEEVVKLTGDADLELRAKAMQLPARGLKIGELAPEIFGVDIDGVPFNLSDYRGKVVVLDFWGDW